ncbi:MAG: acyltransferase family protein, partial [Actinomycetota bacterium]
ATALAGLGFAMIAYALLTIDSSTPFPGWNAVLPVVGTLLVIAARLGPENPLGLPLALAPTQWLGRVSYGWYLWHWPFIVVAELYFGTLSGPARIVAALASLVVADITHRIIENPVRFHPKLVARHLPNYGLALALLAVSLTVAFASLASANNQLEQPRYQELLAAAEDGFSTFERGCQTNDAAHISENCVWGDPGGSRSVLLLGDSHAEQWMPALDTIGTNNSLRILARVVAACPAIEVGVGFAPNPGLCAETQAGTIDVVTEIAPDVVVVSHAAAAIQVLDNELWATRTAEFLAAMDAAGIEVVWIHDTPTLDFDPIECLGSRDLDTCTPGRWESTNFAEELRAIDQPALDAVGGFSYDPLQELCDDEQCLLRFRNVLVFQDDNHITTAASLALVPELEPIVVAALG